MEYGRLKDKVIVISGGTKGVGRAFAEVAGREGAKIVIESGIFRTFGFQATAVWDGESYSFGDGISPGYSGFPGLKGKVDVDDSGLTVTYESYGTMANVVPEGWEDVYVFTEKTPLP